MPALLQKGMSGPDWDEYRRRKPQLTIQSDANRIDFLDGTVSTELSADSTPIKSVEVRQLRRLLDGKASHHVLYVSDLFRVAQNGVQGAQEGTCVPHCDYDGMKAGLSKELQHFESIKGCHPFEDRLLPRAAA